MVIISTGFLYK